MLRKLAIKQNFPFYQSGNFILTICAPAAPLIFRIIRPKGGIFCGRRKIGDLAPSPNTSDDVSPCCLLKRWDGVKILAKYDIKVVVENLVEGLLANVGM